MRLHSNSRPRLSVYADRRGRRRVK